MFADTVLAARYLLAYRHGNFVFALTLLERACVRACVRRDGGGGGRGGGGGGGSGGGEPMTGDTDPVAFCLRAAVRND